VNSLSKESNKDLPQKGKISAEFAKKTIVNFETENITLDRLKNLQHHSSQSTRSKSGRVRRAGWGSGKGQRGNETTAT
jgi:hypothetical protein